jgi:hypothetical protein
MQLFCGLFLWKVSIAWSYVFGKNENLSVENRENSPKWIKKGPPDPDQLFINHPIIIPQSINTRINQTYDRYNTKARFSPEIKKKSEFIIKKKNENINII